MEEDKKQEEQELGRVEPEQEQHPQEPVEQAPVEKEPRNPDQEWAKALGLDYDPEKAQPAGPPPVPEEAKPVQEAPKYEEPQYTTQQAAPNFGPQYQAPKYEEPDPMPSTYLVWSVLATVFCCFIPGIVGIVYSSMVSSKYYAHDYEGAKRASERAQIWIIISIVLGVVTNAVYLPLMMLGESLG